jgi:hypothetical protein
MDASEVHVEAALKEDVKIVYWNYLDGGSGSATIADPLGRALELDHTPYGTIGNISWVQFLDDLITLAHRLRGLVIVVDRADLLLRERPGDFFNLIEAFLLQFHHWYDQKKPCHLCFQMEENQLVRALFGAETGSA